MGAETNHGCFAWLWSLVLGCPKDKISVLVPGLEGQVPGRILGLD